MLQSPDLPAAVETIRHWPATAAVSLMELPEFERLGLSELPLLFDEKMPLWLHLPIRDHDVPGTAWLERWRLARLIIAKLLLEGKNVVIHCLGGIGRTGTVAALCLIDAGVCRGRDAIDLIRRNYNVHAIETPEQRSFVSRYRPDHVLAGASVQSGLRQLSMQMEVRSLLDDRGNLDPANTRVVLDQIS